MEKYEVIFVGRKVGDIGKLYEVSLTIEAPHAQAATAEVYKEYEHISFISFGLAEKPKKFNSYYVSLVRNFVNCCIVIRAESEDHVRRYAVNYLGKIWCSVYKDQGKMILIGNSISVNEDGEEI